MIVDKLCNWLDKVDERVENSQISQKLDNLCDYLEDKYDIDDYIPRHKKRRRLKIRIRRKH